MIGSGMMGGLGQPRDARIEFWSKPEMWPEDSKDYVFAGRGLLEFARRLFGDEWSDAVAAMDLSFALPDKLHLHTERSDIERAITLLQKAGRRAGAPPLNWFLAVEQEFPTQSEWQQARKIADEERDRCWAMFWRYEHVIRILANAARDGEVKTATCAKDGGEMHDEPWHFWNFADRHNRFDTCQIYEDGNTLLSLGKQLPKRWIYFKRDSISRLPQSQKAAISIPTQNNLANEELRKPNRRNRGGRPPEHAWRQIAAVFFEGVQSGRWEGLSVQRIADELKSWCLEQGRKEPADSIIRDRVSEWMIASGVAGNPDE